MHSRLMAVHSFPETYVFKVIGVNSPGFIARVVQAAVNALGGGDRLTVSTRESAAGRHVSVTLNAYVEDADEVLDAYELLTVVRGVRFLV